MCFLGKTTPVHPLLKASGSRAGHVGAVDDRLVPGTGDRGVCVFINTASETGTRAK